MKITILFIIAFFSLQFSYAQLTGAEDYYKDVNCKKSLLIVHYNVENLFDTIDDPHKIDNAFLPDGKKEWTSERYWAKQQKIAYVLQQIDPEHLPDIVTLVEIENLSVLQDLVKQKEIEAAKYKVVHHEGPDARGIDCAILYNPKSFELLESKFYKVTIEGDNRFKTREIVYAKGLTKSKDTLHVFVNHWPSRRGGQEKSEHKRIRAAQVLRLAVDSIFKSNNDAKIVILGDFNDETNNLSIDSVLNAKAASSPFYMSLFNMSTQLDNKGIGTYHYWKTNEWNMLDQMIVSTNLQGDFSGGLMVKSWEMQIFSPDWLMHKDKKGKKTPSKTYGKGYYGGYSDHLPIYQYFYWKCKRD